VTAAPSIGAILREAQDLGFLGPGPVDDHVHHAAVLAELAGPIEDGWLDLGSGGGVPGLVWLATRQVGSAVLVEANTRRCAFLVDAVDRLGLGQRARVLEGRAEVLARQPDLRASFSLVVARSFGAPAVTAECAAGFLTPVGRLVVSEPPDEGVTVALGAVDPVERWPSDGLATLGFTPAALRRREGAGVAIMSRSGPVGDRWPRRDGVPAKRPLW
jgi:16S rRNA (guanine527-N7)-methyltransferase